MGADPAEAAGSLEIRRVLPAPPEDVFAAWTDAELMRRWMSPVGRAEVGVDLRVGGSFRIVMVGEGRTIEHTGRYLEVDPPRRLLFTWESPYTGPRPSVVRVELRAVDRGTELTLTHEQLSEEAAALHRDGWGRMLERLEEALGKRGSP